MRYRFIYALILTFLIPSFAFASQCSKNGYTVLTVNGVLTDQDGAIKNRNALKNSLLF